MTGAESIPPARAPWIWSKLDRASLLGIAAGLALELQPFWDGGLRAGFLVLLAAVVLQIAASHAAAPKRAAAEAD